MSDNVSRIDVRGTVINSVTGEPIPRALVTLGGREAHSLLTDNDGQFVFERVPLEGIYIQVRKPGFFERQPIFLSPDAKKDVVVKMSPAGLIFGQVTDEDGEPIEHAQVSLLQRFVNGRGKWARANGAQTDDQGRYRLPNVRPAKYLIEVTPPWNIASDSGRSGYTPVFYPKARDISSATPVDIVAGEQAEANLELSRVPVFHISGVVTGPKAQGLNVELTDELGNEVAFARRTDLATGEFEISSAPKGTYTLRARGFWNPGSGEEQLTAKTTVTVNADLLRIVLTLRPPILIPVQVRSESPQPVVQDSANRFPRIEISPYPAADDEMRGFLSFDGSSEGGHYSFHLSQPGAYQLRIIVLGDGYVRSATSGNTDLLQDPLVVPASGGVEPIEVVIGSDGAKLRGTVHESAGGTALVVAVPDLEHRQPVLTSCGPQGQFSFQSLAPGDYSLYAIRASDGMDYTDRNAVTPFRSKGTRVTLGPNQTSEVTLDLIETEQ